MNFVWFADELEQLEKEGRLVKTSHIQEDFRRVTDGSYVSSHGRVITYGKRLIQA